MSKEQAKEKKKIKKEVNCRLGRGEPKQMILEEMSQEHKDKITIVKLLEATPSKFMKQKYMMHKHLLTVLLLAALVLDTVSLFRLEWGNVIIDFFTCLNVAIDLVLLVGTIAYRIETFSWIAARGIISLIQIVITHLYYHLPIDVLTLVVLGLVVISFLLGLFLSIKLCPPRIPKTIEVDIDGNEKINKTVYVFPD